jgi:hypothetical protein
MVQHTGDEMRDGRNDLAQSCVRQIGKNGGGNLTPDVGKRVAVEKQKGSAAMTVPQEF